VVLRSHAVRRAALCLAGLLAALSALVWATGARAQEASLEDAVKATYLYKFAPFVTWPAGAFAVPAEPFWLCLQGDDPFGSIIDRAVAGQSVGGRPIALRRLRAVDSQSRCHILYVAGSASQGIAEALAAVDDRPMLTVTDAAIARDIKGIVHFVVRDNRVRFEINDYAAWQHGLTISSRVLSLAVAVRPRP
jgi:hypothetical protein